MIPRVKLTNNAIQPAQHVILPQIIAPLVSKATTKNSSHARNVQSFVRLVQVNNIVQRLLKGGISTVN
jgi:hypothetical protein